MPHVHLKEKTIVEMPFVEEQGRHETECTSCTKVNKDDKDLVTEGCAGEYVRQLPTFMPRPTKTRS